jgi:hypothetical protein
MPKPTVCVLFALAAVVACGPQASIDELPAASSSGAEPSDSSSSSSATGTTMAPEEPEPGSDSSSESDGDPGSNFLEHPDGGGGSFECDPFTQSCPAGQKCMYWANDGGGSWNATRCTDVAPNADEVGEPCTVEGSGTSGIDSCVLGAMCWDVNPETNEGTCLELCMGSESEPICADPAMMCAGRGPFLCLPSCCPIEQDCAEGDGCYPVNDTFYCAPDASGDQGGFGDGCEFINVCNPGLMCLDSSVLPPGYPCEDAYGCCTAFCEIDKTSCSLLDPALECTPWFEEGSAPPGLELIGACVVPQ